ncbi:hypothetical protein M441DRAFT_399857 [Trichoderma asperellum CBS 433.97]|uniref:Uncharacterized protein n=1 Tax=Trichoderma asperellum (strain ATCC 204424 / CBS 433.97 / NBRC 101777) TaxID=1042311 RepID=A0A2T3Z9M1_TRIA4|nr:hypothetical protein M441DRAFT_399857 [Trichoderma asperellum CBS 433.97]PTB41509.1 hypothetical protein M441DRAFT_399857 [Trichoderma asperellum CBS 433.97]
MILHEPTEYLSEVCDGCHSFSLFLFLSIFVRVCVSITNIFVDPGLLPSSAAAADLGSH